LFEGLQSRYFKTQLYRPNINVKLLEYLNVRILNKNLLSLKI